MHSTVAPSGVRMHYSGNTSSHKNRRSVLERLSLPVVSTTGRFACFSNLASSITILRDSSHLEYLALFSFILLESFIPKQQSGHNLQNIRS